MIVDDRVLTDSLHSIETSVAPDLAGRARRGGRRRLLRRRAYAAGGAVAVVAAATPLTLAMTGSRPAASGVKVTASPTPNGNAGGLYASPPRPGTLCFTSDGHRAPGFHPGSYDPNLFLLPAHTAVLSAFYSAGSEVASCHPHDALTLLQQTGARVTAGLVVSGPNAPSARQAGYEGHGISFGGQKGHASVQGDAAQEFTVRVTGGSATTVFWTGKLGDQWQARASGLTQQATVALLNRLQLDPHTGTATLPNAGAWRVAASAPDQTSSHVETFNAQWRNRAGVTIDLTVTTQPTELDQQAALSSEASFTAVDGHLAVLSYSTQFATLEWQSSPHTWVQLMAERGTTSDVTQAAAALTLTTRNDPRIH